MTESTISSESTFEFYPPHLVGRVSVSFCSQNSSNPAIPNLLYHIQSISTRQVITPEACNKAFLMGIYHEKALLPPLFILAHSFRKGEWRKWQHFTFFICFKAWCLKPICWICPLIASGIISFWTESQTAIQFPLSQIQHKFCFPHVSGRRKPTVLRLCSLSFSWLKVGSRQGLLVAWIGLEWIPDVLIFALAQRPLPLNTNQWLCCFSSDFKFLFSSNDFVLKNKI